ncbi:MAG: molecular chaperone HtpG [Proteobacteria bacterium]|nr:molecular chaperone HtpG [Pseudomonadota bacterium]MDA1354715.1 molecular chaperone HtpG [Pseudomonadota bacterium]
MGETPVEETPRSDAVQAESAPAESAKSETAKSETHEFQAEVSKLLDLMINSLYKDKDIFLRELIANASDACDKLRYAAITEPALLADDSDLKVTLSVDTEARTLTIQDNGIGMNHDDLVQNLGTIARSGTEAFLKQIKESDEEAAADTNLIGQFGVGFYSSFMVAGKVDVFTRRAGEDTGWHWESKGRGKFSILRDDSAARGARIVLHLRKAEADFLDPLRIRHIVSTYSDHIALPIQLLGDSGAAETLNEGSALWTRSASDISEDQHKEFYRHVAHLPGDPWMTVHMHAEGRFEYTALLYVPDMRPFDLFDPARAHRVRLYVKRVFITEECDGLVPGYLRFMRGIVDCNDLPLNVSRETLQHNPLLAKISSGLVKRILSELEKKSKKEPENYADFWENFGAVLKEGIYEASDSRDKLMKLARFRSLTCGEKWISLDDYVAAMADGQEAIYYLSGSADAGLERSPQLEGFKARGIDVLFMTDPVDQFWLPTAADFNGKAFRSITQGSADLDKFETVKKSTGEDAAAADEEKASDGDMDKLIALVKLTLGEEVKDVRTSSRLTDSPVCLVADDGDVDMHFERLLRQHQQPVTGQKRVLEINPGHSLTRALAALVTREGASDALEDAAHLLLDQARILEGEPLPDPASFSRRLAGILTKTLSA